MKRWSVKPGKDLESEVDMHCMHMPLDAVNFAILF
jgi:hypothetical protein